MSGYDHPKGPLIGWSRQPSLFCLIMGLLGQRGIPHHHVNVHFVGLGHPLEEVQTLFLIPPQLDPIFFELHIYVPVSPELYKTPKYLMVEGEKLVLLALQGGLCHENGYDITVFRSDHGKEFENIFNCFYSQYGIFHYFQFQELQNKIELLSRKIKSCKK